MKNIPVRIGLELLIPLNLIFIFTIIAGFMDEKTSAVVIGFIILLFINYTFFSIRYFVDEQNILRIKNGIFGTTKIPVKDIYKIEKTWNPLTSPAPGIFGRVEIYWTKYNSIIISPKNFNDFKDELLKINPDITVKEKI
ncbi:MAG: PH domain-containing protein [Bergeyella sp.]